MGYIYSSGCSCVFRKGRREWYKVQCRVTDFSRKQGACPSFFPGVDLLSFVGRTGPAQLEKYTAGVRDLDTAPRTSRTWRGHLILAG